jgi:hypothetical protein
VSEFCLPIKEQKRKEVPLVFVVILVSCCEKIRDLSVMCIFRILLLAYISSRATCFFLTYDFVHSVCAAAI